MTFVSLLGFAGLCLMLALIPGPDTFLILRISLSRASAGIAAAAGCGLGAVVWGALVGLGLAAILEQSAEVFRLVKIAGGLYLMYLGISALIKAHRARKVGVSGGSAAQAPLTFSHRGAFGAGALSTLLNPKVGLFYLAVVPQFIPHGGNTLGTALLLGLTLAIIGSLYLVVIALVAYKTMKWLKKPKVNTALERTSSAILAALGAGVLASAATA